MPPQAKTKSGSLLICGSGRCLWDDVSQWQHLKHPPFDGIMTVNDTVMYLPWQVNFAYSHDDVQLVHWVKGRRRKYLNNFGCDIELHSVTHCNSEGVVEWPFPSSGSSGLGAAYVGVAMGYSRIVLAGLPLDDSGHFYDPPWVKTNFIRESRERHWREANERLFKGRVRSFSGRSREILGAPDDHLPRA